MLKETWIEVRFLMPAGMQEEGAMFLTEFSGRGVILEEEGAPAGGVVIRAFFRPEEFGPWQQEQLQDYLKRLAGHGLYPLGLEMRRVAEEDWAEAWKAHFKPLKVTDRLVIRPPWEDYAPAAGELVLTIYPGMAFGTGRHPTTLLCLRALEEVWGPGLPQLADPWQVLDVGTGTGILALAAARLGAGVLAIDVDPEAVAAALENVRLNALEERILVEPTLLHAIRQQFALILANLTAPDLLHLAEGLTGHLVGGGALIISGFMEKDLPQLQARFLGLGLKEAGYQTQEEWGVLILRRPRGSEQ
jgi:ribosomal protein L11 methyltransferase